MYAFVRFSRARVNPCNVELVQMPTAQTHNRYQEA